MKADFTGPMGCLRLVLIQLLSERHSWKMGSFGRGEWTREARSYVAAIRVLELANGTRVVKGVRT